MELNKLHHGLPYQAYHDAEGFRASYLSNLRRSPAHFFALKNEDEPTQAKEDGKLFHSVMENGEKFLDLAKVEPEFIGMTKDGKPSAQSKEAKEKRVDWRMSLPAGSLIVSQDQYDMLTGMLKAMNSHRVARALIKNGVRETSGFVKDPETGLILKFRPDLISEPGYIIDYKSARDASRPAFWQEIFKEWKRFYVLSAAHYAYCAKLMGLPRSDELTYIAIEKKKPYGINIFPLEAAHIDYGESFRRPLMSLYAKCLEEDTWPGYDERVKPTPLPVYDADWKDLGDQIEEEA